MSYTVAKGNQRVDPDDVKVAGKAPEGVVDLRSDTVTRPTAEMRQAMATAEVGDDVYGEDPTVNKLEKRAAEIFEKEAALFVPTGCMGNLISIKIWTHHGNEVVCEERSHVNLYELASMSAIAGCMPRVARAEDGILTWEEIKAVIRPKIYYDSQTALGCLENTSNMAGGGMRQAGVIAAAGLIALEKSPARLHVDHENAKLLAEGIAQIPGLKIDPEKVRSNIVIFDCAQAGMTAVELCDAVHAHGVWVQDTALYLVRVVTHSDVDRAGCERALTVLKEVVTRKRKAGG